MSVKILKKREEETNGNTGATEYTPSDAVRSAQTKVNSVQTPQYTSVWQQELSDTMKKIQNREPFSYNINGDALYEQYRQKYINQGKQAMDDTVGKVASLTGGYGNSYAVTAGSQAYNEHLSKLNDVIPELYNLAYNRYAAEGDALERQYSLLSQREAEDYARWRDSVADARYADEIKYAREQDALDRKYMEDRDKVEDAWRGTEFRYGVEQDAKNWDYQLGRDAVGDARYADETSYNRGQDTKSWEYQLGRDAVEDARYADETKYNREQDRLDYALSLIKAGNGGEGEPIKYTPYGEYTAGEFIEKLSELAAEYSEAEQYGADGSAAIRSAVALTNAIGTEEAMNAFREVFGDDVYKNSMVYTDRMREFEAGMKTEREVAGRGIDYGDYYMEKVLSALDRNELDVNEAATLLDEHGLIERFNDEYGK